MQKKECVTFGSSDESFGHMQNQNTMSKSMNASSPEDTKQKSVSQKAKSTKRKNLSVREDVMNKNIFRAFKRELKTIYTSFLNSRGLNDDKDIMKTKFVQSISIFTDGLVQELGFDTESIKGFNKDTCKTLIGIFLDYCYMKKILKAKSDKDLLTKTFDVIYSYSHQKFYEFLEIPEIKVIFRLVILKSSMEGFIANHESLGKDKYKTHLNNIMEKL